MTADNKPNVSADSIDLLDKLLRYNHLDRLTASEALAHCFFSTCIFLAPPTATPYYASSRPIPCSVFYSPNTIDMLMNHLYLFSPRPSRLCTTDAVRLETPSNPAECVSDSGFYST